MNAASNYCEWFEWDSEVDVYEFVLIYEESDESSLIVTPICF